MKLNSTLALAGLKLACATTMAWAAKPELTGQRRQFRGKLVPVEPGHQQPSDLAAQ